MAFPIAQRDPSGRNLKAVKVWLENGTAGDDWYYGFLERQKILSLRKPEKLSHARAVMGNDTVINDYYVKLEKNLDELGVRQLPQFIYNADETGVPLDFVPSRVVAPKKCKNLWAVSSGDRTNITVMACASAVGDVLPPFVIFKGKKDNPTLKESSPPDWCVMLSEKGWINCILFEAWLGNVLVPYHKKQISSGNLPADQPGLLLVDGHSSHESLAAIEMAKANNTTIFCLPPHLTHLLQPLDVSYFRSLKSNWSREAETFGRDPRNEGKYVTKATFCRTFHKAWEKTIAKRETVTNGFRRCGLFPFRRVSLADVLQDRLPPSHALHREADDDVPQLDEAGDAGIQIVDEGTRVSSEVGQTVDRGTWVSNEVGQTVDRGTRVSNEVGQTVDRGTRVSNEMGQTVDGGTQVSNEVGQTVDRETRVSN